MGGRLDQQSSHPAARLDVLSWRMSYSENRFPLFRDMRWPIGSNILQVQHGRGVGAHAPAKLSILDQRFAVGRDDALQLGGPARLELVGKAALDDLERDEDRGGRAGRGAEQRDQRAVGGRDQFGAELQYSGAPRIRLDDLHALPRYFELPVPGLRAGKVFLQRGEAVPRRL